MFTSVKKLTALDPLELSGTKRGRRDKTRFHDRFESALNSRDFGFVYAILGNSDKLQELVLDFTVDILVWGRYLT
jgi:hypothetical protein